MHFGRQMTLDVITMRCYDTQDRHGFLPPACLLKCFAATKALSGFSQKVLYREEQFLTIYCFLPLFHYKETLCKHHDVDNEPFAIACR